MKKFTLLLLLLLPFSAVHALQGLIGIHDPSSIIRRNGVYHVWGTGNQIYHLTSTDLINWTPAPTVFATGSWPSWINTYVSGFAGIFWAPECIFMNGRYYMYYSCALVGRPSAIGVATSTDLTNWTDQGMVVSSTTSSAYSSIDPAVFSDASGNYWMTFGSHLTGIWIAQLNTSTGKRLNSTLTNIAGSSNTDMEASYVIRSGGYYYLFYNRGICCNGTGSTYYMQMGRSTSPTGPYVDRNGTALLSGGGTTVFSSSGNFIGPGHVGYYQENGYNFLTYHYYDGNNNGTPTLGVANVGWESSGWPFFTRDWIGAGRYQITNRNSGLVWDAWGCTGASLQAIAQGTPSNLTCQQWNFTSLGNGVWRINCAMGGLAAEVYNCAATNGSPLDLYSYWGATCQQFRLERAGDGSLVFSSVNGNRVVEVPNASTTAGQQLALYDYNGCNCQKWTLSTVSSARMAAHINDSIAGLQLYPNPASTVQGVTINLPPDPVTRIRILNAAGVVVRDEQTQHVSRLIIGQGLPAGIYFIQISSSTAAVTKKIVIQ